MSRFYLVSDPARASREYLNYDALTWCGFQARVVPQDHHRSSLRRCAQHCWQRKSEIYAEKLRAAGVAVASSRLP